MRAGSRRGHEKHFGTGKDDTNVPDGPHSPPSPGACPGAQFSLLPSFSFLPAVSPHFNAPCGATGQCCLSQGLRGHQENPRKVAAAMAGSGHPQGYLEHLMSKASTCFCGQLHYSCWRGHSGLLHDFCLVGCWCGLFYGHLSFPPLLPAGMAISTDHCIAPIGVAAAATVASSMATLLA